jgi:trehalose 6-phosphate synthase
VVSNRVADPRSSRWWFGGGASDALAAPAGCGLAGAGRQIADAAAVPAQPHRIEQAGNVAGHGRFDIETMPVTTWLQQWRAVAGVPFAADLARFEADIAAYRRVNRMFARHLMALLQPDDIVWVHDYLIPLRPNCARYAKTGWGFRTFLCCRSRCAGCYSAARLAGARHVCL